MEYEASESQISKTSTGFDHLLFGGNLYEMESERLQRPLDQQFVTQQRIHRMVLAGLEGKLEAILQAHSWERLTEIAPRIPHPGIEDWVDLQISSGQGVKFYPCLIRDADGLIRFLKVQVTRKNGRFGMETDQIILKEAKILQSGILPLRTPAYVDHSCGSDTSLAFLCTEAIPFDEGRVLNAKDWQPTFSRSVASQIHALEGILLMSVQNILSMDYETNIVEMTSNLVERAGEHLDAHFGSSIMALVQSAPLPGVFSHGDLTLNNMITCGNGTVEFIDWENAGITFIGQDASKFFEGIKNNLPAKNAFIETYTTRINGLPDRQRFLGLSAGIILENLGHLVWRVERITPELEPKYPGIRSQIPLFRENIRLAIKDYWQSLKH